MKHIIKIFILGFLLSGTLNCQIYPASYSNWLFPDGNSEATKYQVVPSKQQDIKNFTIKWSSSSIAGDVQPLIGNIINNPKIFPLMTYAPNEIAAVVAGKIVVIDALGRTHTMNSTPMSYIKNISVLFDTTLTTLNSRVQNPIAMGLETSEFKNDKDSVAFTYIAGFDNNADTVAYLKRLAIDLRKDFTNYYASIKPIWGKRFQNNFIVYAEINMKNPKDSIGFDPSYFRGLAEFNSKNLLYNYPLPDIGDSLEFRVYTAPEISFATPSLSFLGGLKTSILLPNYPATNLQQPVFNSVSAGLPTEPGKSYLMSYEIRNGGIYQDIGPDELTGIIPAKSTKPEIRPYYLHTFNDVTRDSLILVAEQYRGIDSSHGISKLHLYNSLGVAITSPGNLANPSFIGGKDHLWSIAVGDADGINPANKWLPYYPQYPGKEIIVTQTTRDFVVAGSKLFILKYNENTIPKPTPPDSYLFPLDTIASQRINGWVAAVNDLDGEPDKKDEIALVDGSTLRIVRLRDYTDKRFQSGMPFDTVYSCNFPNETISNVAISDVDGDGMNDLVVTTYFNTYLIGSLIPYTLKIVPEVLPQMPICSGDTIKFKWANLIRSYGEVDVKFNVYSGGNPTTDTIMIYEKYKNDKDTIQFSYIIGKELIGKSGRFIIENRSHPTLIYDSTAIYSFAIPTLSIDPMASTSYRSGDKFLVSGTTLCVDSVNLEFSLDGIKGWQKMTSLKTDAAGRFMLSSVMPCPPIFNYRTQDLNNGIFLRVEYFGYQYKDSTVPAFIMLKPTLFPLTFDTSTTICPTIEFTWNVNNIQTVCDSISVLVSIDGGLSFVFLEQMDSKIGKFVWKIPLTLPDSVMVRFCCEGGCERIDTTIYNFKPKYINIVSPNPFNPLKEELEICYQVPEETNVSIKVLDQNNRIVAEPLSSQHRQPGIAYCDRWSGNMWDKSPAANGMYYLVMEFSNSTKEVYPVFIRR